MSYSKGFRFKDSDLGVFKNDADEVAKKLIDNVNVIGLTDGSFSLIDLIHSILKYFGRSNVAVSTWSAGIKDSNQIKWMMETDLINAFTLLLDCSFESRKKKYAIEVDRLFGKESIRLAYSHAKFVLIETEKGEKISISTSMNLNKNKTCENFEVDRGGKVYDFYRTYVDKHFNDVPCGFDVEFYKISKAKKDYFNQINGEGEEKTTKKWWSNE